LSRQWSIFVHPAGVGPETCTRFRWHTLIAPRTAKIAHAGAGCQTDVLTMTVSMTPEQFIKKWRGVTLSERSAAQQHFLDICALLSEPTPVEVDPTGETFTFEKGGTTATGGHGWADVWKKNCFAWEYKGPGKDLNAAYLQLKKYADMLDNPPLLITSDIKRIEIHTNFTNTVKVVHSIETEDLGQPAIRDILRSAFTNPEKLRPGVTRQQVTTAAAATFSELARNLQGKGYEPQRVAHFLNRIVFCMFAEDVGLLPNKIFTKLATASVAHPDAFEANARQLFLGMAKGGPVAFELIDWFNGGLFDDDATLPLDHAELNILLKCAELDWSNIEPSIFGTLFERGLDPSKRSQQGTHYTDPETIMKIVKPVVLEPWIEEWEAEKRWLARQIDRAKVSVSEAAKQRFYGFLERLANFKVLDPACGSGNFLYLTLRGLKDFEKKVVLEAEALGLPPQFPRVGPEALLGIEVNPYAAELARVTIWIGELQWMIENGFAWSKNPILKPLDQIVCRDAVLNDDGTEPDWPKADVIIGNPPFLGDKKMRAGLGDAYVAALRHSYEGRVPGGADLVVYWFRKAFESVVGNLSKLVGFVGTQSIRKGANRRVLDAIATQGTIFEVWSDEEWVNEGAAVRVSMVCFGNRPLAGKHVVRRDGTEVKTIYSDLRAEGLTGSGGAVDVTRAESISENSGTAFIGSQKTGPFGIPGTLARKWLMSPNPHGLPNSNVLRPWANGMDVMRRPSDTWIIDFGINMREEEAALFEEPFRYLLENVKSVRTSNREVLAGKRWWLHQRPRPEMRQALVGHDRFIVTPRVATHRVFIWLDSSVLADSRLCVIARSDDTTFGILESSFHRVWSLTNASMHGVGNDPTYNARSCFESFPFPPALTPLSPEKQYIDNPHAKRIAACAKRLNDLREEWLNPAELTTRVAEVATARNYPARFIPKDATAAAQLKKRTLTHLYNSIPTWLQIAHRDLDESVAAAYGWELPLSDDEIIGRLFELNQQRAKPMDVRPTAKPGLSRAKKKLKPD
jgi:hypothetical protein